MLNVRLPNRKLWSIPGLVLVSSILLFLGWLLGVFSLGSGVVDEVQKEDARMSEGWISSESLRSNYDAKKAVLEQRIDFYESCGERLRSGETVGLAIQCKVLPADGPGIVVASYVDLDKVDSVIVVDAGGPLLPAGALNVWTEAIAEMAPGSLVLAVSVDSNGPVDVECAEAFAVVDGNLFDCPIDEILMEHTSGYAAALDVAVGKLGVAELPIGLLGTSFAGVRWSVIFAQELGPNVDVSVMVTPVFPGFDPDMLETSSFEHAARMFSEALEEQGCLSTEECGSGPTIAEVRRLFDMGQFEFESGVAAVARSDENLRLVAEAAVGGDYVTGKLYVVEGHESYMGRDAFGLTHTSEVHLLSTLCPFAKANTIVSPRWETCNGFDRLTVDRQASWDNPNAPDGTCVYHGELDPVVGVAGAYGDKFGRNVNMGRPDNVRHGDLLVGVQPLRYFLADHARIDQISGTTCVAALGCKPGQPCPPPLDPAATDP
jgi:hypothetical protein